MRSDKDVDTSGGIMKAWNAASHRTANEVHGASRSDGVTSPWRPGDLELDLVDVMLDLDPGALVWRPSRSPVAAVPRRVTAG